MHLLKEHILLPGVSVLVRLVGEVRRAENERLHEPLSGRLSNGIQQALERLRTTPARPRAGCRRIGWGWRGGWRRAGWARSAPSRRHRGGRSSPGERATAARHSCRSGLRGSTNSGLRRKQDAIAVRKAGEAALRRRLEQAADLPSHYEPAALAALVHTISDGIAVQAAAGRSHDELRQIGDLALRALLD
ncbi:hypothetical protein ABZU75_25145 [Streptosporangium sp. NPDC005286]|uniref:hypothetical protein n=1 Tax=Streptosporangium sp. NPDC005286 TaxID=3154463 RepID=UPI0033B79264